MTSSRSLKHTENYYSHFITKCKENIDELEDKTFVERLVFLFERNTFFLRTLTLSVVLKPMV